MVNNSVKGLSLPQEKSLSAGNPKDSAIASNNEATLRHAELIKATSGGSRKKKGGAASSQVAVPQFQMQYKPTGAGGQNPNDIIKQNSSVSIQNAENAKYDSYARKGGSKKRRSKKRYSKKYKKGGNIKWGCYSGGKKHKTKRRK